jgi:uncharacterized protein (DUF2345 family)
MGVSPVVAVSSASSPARQRQKQQQQDRAGTALEHTGKMPVPHHTLLHRKGPAGIYARTPRKKDEHNEE